MRAAAFFVLAEGEGVVLIVFNYWREVQIVLDSEAKLLNNVINRNGAPRLLHPI